MAAPKQVAAVVCLSCSFRGWFIPLSVGEWCQVVTRGFVGAVGNAGSAVGAAAASFGGRWVVAVGLLAGWIGRLRPLRIGANELPGLRRLANTGVAELSPDTQSGGRRIGSW